MSVADRFSEGFITSTAWSPEREKPNLRRIPVYAVGKNFLSPWHRETTSRWQAHALAMPLSRGPVLVSSTSRPVKDAGLL
jgi:hypothetical protein